MTTRAQIEILYERLKKHPHLKNRFDQILNIVEDENDAMGDAHQVEEKAIEELRKLGNQVMRDWAKKKSDEKKIDFETDNQTATYHEKKSSGGIRHSEKSKRQK